MDTWHKSNIRKTFRKRPGRLLHPLSRGLACKMNNFEHKLSHCRYSWDVSYYVCSASSFAFLMHATKVPSANALDGTGKRICRNYFESFLIFWYANSAFEGMFELIHPVLKLPNRNYTRLLWCFWIALIFKRYFLNTLEMFSFLLV